MNTAIASTKKSPIDTGWHVTNNDRNNRQTRSFPGESGHFPSQRRTSILSQHHQLWNKPLGTLKLDMGHCTFSNNPSTYGGAMLAVNSIVTVIRSNCFGNISKIDVGSVWSLTLQEAGDSERYQMTVTGGDFTKNKASNYYSAMCCNFTHPLIQYCHFYGNEADLSVGGLGLLGYASAIVSDTDFQANTCLQNRGMACPAVWVQGAAQSEAVFSVHFENTLFVSNLVKWRQNAHIVTYEKVKLIFRSYNCFDVPETLAYTSVKGQASYDTETINRRYLSMTLTTSRNEKLVSQRTYSQHQSSSHLQRNQPLPRQSHWKHTALVSHIHRPIHLRHNRLHPVPSR